MKRSRIFTMMALILATGGAFGFKTSSTINSKFLPNRFKNIANCPGVTCGATGSTSCNGFYTKSNCTQPVSDDLLYTP